MPAIPSGFSGVTTILDKTADVLESLVLLSSTKVMVGVPSEKGDRKQGPISNAALAYIHDKGSPAANIPARPFMQPGVESVKNEIEEAFRKAGTLALTSTPAAVERQLNRVGMIGRDAIKAKIRSNIPPPLALGTVMGRIRRHGGKAARQEMVKANLASGLAPQADLFIALIDTAQMLNSISYVLRKK